MYSITLNAPMIFAIRFYLVHFLNTLTEIIPNVSASSQINDEGHLLDGPLFEEEGAHLRGTLFMHFHSDQAVFQKGCLFVFCLICLISLWNSLK